MTASGEIANTVGGLSIIGTSSITGNATIAGTLTVSNGLTCSGITSSVSVMYLTTSSLPQVISHLLVKIVFGVISTAVVLGNTMLRSLLCQIQTVSH